MFKYFININHWELKRFITINTLSNRAFWTHRSYSWVAIFFGTSFFFLLYVVPSEERLRLLHDSKYVHFSECSNRKLNVLRKTAGAHHAEIKWCKGSTRQEDRSRWCAPEVRSDEHAAVVCLRRDSVIAVIADASVNVVLRLFCGRRSDGSQSPFTLPGPDHVLCARRLDMHEWLGYTLRFDTVRRTGLRKCETNQKCGSKGKRDRLPPSRVRRAELCCKDNDERPMHTRRHTNHVPKINNKYAAKTALRLPGFAQRVAFTVFRLPFRVSPAWIIHKAQSVCSVNN